MGSLMAALWRRKLLALLAVLLAVGAGYGVAARGGPTYSYTATALLLPPEGARNVSPDAVDYTAGNPLFYLGSLGQARDILIGAMTSKDVQESIGKSFPGTTYTVSSDILNSAPVVILNATGPNEEASKALVGVLAKLLPNVLAQVQKGVGVETSARITSFQLTSDADPIVSHKSQIRMAIVAAGATGVVLLLMIGAVDGLLRGRRFVRPRRARAAAASGPPAEATGPAVAEPPAEASPAAVITRMPHAGRTRAVEGEKADDEGRVSEDDETAEKAESPDSDDDEDDEGSAWFTKPQVVGQ